MIKSESEIYAVLEELLRAAGDKPQTCVDLFDDHRIKSLVENPNRVSDYLGHMWRRNLLQRWYAPKDSNSRARYAYTWLEQPEEVQQPVARLTSVPTRAKPNVTVTESDGAVTLDFAEFTITVVRK